MVSVLAMPGLLTTGVLGEFEQSDKVLVRTELVQSHAEFDLKLRLAPKAWQVVVAPESVLLALARAHLVLPAPLSLLESAQGQRPSAADTEPRTFVPLAGDLLGVFWRGETPSPWPHPLTWDILAATPAPWRCQIWLPPDPASQIFLGLLAAGTPRWPEDPKDLRQAAEWAARARMQMCTKAPALERALGTGAAKAGVGWASQKPLLEKLYGPLGFASPQGPLLAGRIGLALVSEPTPHGRRLAAHLVRNRDRLAAAGGLVPLSQWAKDTVLALDAAPPPALAKTLPRVRP